MVEKIPKKWLNKFYLKYKRKFKYKTVDYKVIYAYSSFSIFKIYIILEKRFIFYNLKIENICIERKNISNKIPKNYINLLRGTNLSNLNTINIYLISGYSYITNWDSDLYQIGISHTRNNAIIHSYDQDEDNIKLNKKLGIEYYNLCKYIFDNIPDYSIKYNKLKVI